jgi:hypothetical protein
MRNQILFLCVGESNDKIVAANGRVADKKSETGEAECALTQKCQRQSTSVYVLLARNHWAGFGLKQDILETAPDRMF